MWLPAERFDALPSVLQHGTHIKCVVALITQGINAQQTVANAVAPALVDLQELINAEAALLLRRYYGTDQYDRVWTFNHAERHFNLDAYLATCP